MSSFRRAAPPLSDEPVDRLIKALLIVAAKNDVDRVTLVSDHKEKLALLLKTLESPQTADDRGAVVVLGLPGGTSRVEMVMPPKLWPSVRDRLVALAGGIPDRPREDAGELSIALASWGTLHLALHWRREGNKETVILERLRRRSN